MTNAPRSYRRSDGSIMVEVPDNEFVELAHAVKTGLTHLTPEKLGEVHEAVKKK